MSFCFGALKRPGATGSVVRFDLGGALLNADGDIADDGAAVATWTAAAGTRTLTQATVSTQPLMDDDQFPGRLGIVAAGDDHLTGTLGFDAGTILVICYPLTGDRTLLARDCTATTTKPHFKLELTLVGSAFGVADDAGDVVVDDAGDLISNV